MAERMVMEKELEHHQHSGTLAQLGQSAEYHVRSRGWTEGVQCHWSSGLQS